MNSPILINLRKGPQRLVSAEVQAPKQARMAGRPFASKPQNILIRGKRLPPLQLHMQRGAIQRPNTSEGLLTASSTTPSMKHDSTASLTTMTEMPGQERVGYHRTPSETRVAAWASLTATLGYILSSDSLPGLRLMLLTYIVWAVGEWTIHRYRQ